MYIYIVSSIYIYIYLTSPVIQICSKNSEATELKLTLMANCLRKCFSSEGSIYYVDVPTSCSQMKWAYHGQE